jgi:hypothetical protein
MDNPNFEAYDPWSHDSFTSSGELYRKRCFNSTSSGDCAGIGAGVGSGSGSASGPGRGSMSMYSIPFRVSVLPSCEDVQLCYGQTHEVEIPECHLDAAVATLLRSYLTPHAHSTPTTATSAAVTATASEREREVILIGPNIPLPPNWSNSAQDMEIGHRTRVMRAGSLYEVLQSVRLLKGSFNERRALVIVTDLPLLLRAERERAPQDDYQHQHQHLHQHLHQHQDQHLHQDDQDGLVPDRVFARSTLEMLKSLAYDERAVATVVLTTGGGVRSSGLRDDKDSRTMTPVGIWKAAFPARPCAVVPASRVGVGLAAKEADWLWV